MEFHNKAPFEALAFSAYNVHDEEHHVVVVKVVYRLVRVDTADTHRCELSPGDELGKLSTSDVYEGSAGASSVRAESDLAPFKPRCDVVIRATSYAPGGVASPRWSARLRVSTPERPHPSDEPDAPRGVLIDKTLTIYGPRAFERDGARGGWSLSEPVSVTTVPVRWERAFGGSCVVLDPNATPGETRHLLNEVCFTNPLGTAWVESRYFESLERAKFEAPTRLAAPQVEALGSPVTDVIVSRHPPHGVEAPQMAELARDYMHRPAGLGFVGRAWTPRLQHAGTYDAHWLEHRHPFLPSDFSFRYWNGAPEDQQIAWPGLGARFELTNLCAPEHCPSGVLSFTLPPHRAFALAWIGGLPVPLPAVMDTVLVDAEAMVVTGLWRVLVSRALGVTELEARFETDGDAPLLKLEGDVSHG